MKLVDFGTIEGESKQNVFSYYNDVKSNAMHFLIIKIKLFHSLSWESPLAISIGMFRLNLS